MDKPEIRSTLANVLADAESADFKVIRARESLRQCKFALIEMTSFKQVNPGDQIPQIRMDLAEARDSVERGIEALDRGDIKAMNGELRQASEQIR